MRWLSEAVIALAMFVPVTDSHGDTVVIWHVAHGGNGHAYDLVGTEDPGITWGAAKTAAETITPPEGFLTGHLLTISSEAENDFVTDSFGPSIDWGQAENDGAWAGFTDQFEEGEWRWIDDTPGIWQDPTNFTKPIQTAYVNWVGGGSGREPNNCGDVEHYLSVYGSGEWNDYSTALDDHPNNQYLVEWEPVPAPSSLTCTVGLFAMAFVARWWRRRKAA